MSLAVHVYAFYVNLKFIFKSALWALRYTNVTMARHFTVSSTLYTVALYSVCLFLDLADGGVIITMEIAGQKLFGKVVAGR